MKKTIIFFLGLLPLFVFGQGLYNNGANIVIESGANVYIDGGSNGNYTNANGGLMNIDGVLTLEGDFTNNAANNAFTGVDADGEVVFAGGTQTITSPIANFVNFEKVTVNSGSSTTLVAASGMTTNGTFTVNGTFTSETPTDETVGGSLITGTNAGDVTGTGTLNVNRFFKTNGRWQYVSIPMSGQSSTLFTEHTASGNFNPNFYTYNEKYDEPTDPTNIEYENYDYPGNGFCFYLAWEQVQATAGAGVGLNVANGTKTGYIVYNEGDLNTIFTSTPSNLNHDANYAPTMSFTSNDANSNYYDGWNLVGNPYPCALDWDVIYSSLVAGNNINNCVYMWDGDNGNYVYYGGGTSYKFDNQTLNAGSQYIPAMQSFFVKATATPTFSIPSSARVHNSNQMYKGATSTPDFDFIKLQVETNGQSDQTLVRFFEDATESVDDQFDAYKMYSTTPGLPQIYSIVDEGTEIPVAINSLPIDEYVEYKQVPLGIVVKQNGEYTFSAAEINTKYFDKLYLIDERNTESVTYTDLTLTPSYSVYLEEGENRGRFSLLAVTTFTDIDDIVDNATSVNIYSNGHTVYISIPNIDDVNGDVQIFDALGRNIYTDVANSTYNEFQLNVAPGTYIVKYLTQNNTYIRKISIN